MYSRRGRGGGFRPAASFSSSFEQRVYDKLVAFRESKETGKTSTETSRDNHAGSYKYGMQIFMRRHGVYSEPVSFALIYSVFALFSLCRPTTVFGAI